jgi:hypothetical protein
MFQLFLILAALTQPELSISDSCGNSVIGASICSDSALIGISDANGEVSLPEGTDSVEVRAIGFETWSGSIPSTGRITLSTVPVPSGTVISVTASRPGFRDHFAATTVLGGSDMEYLSRYGLRSLCSKSGGIYVREYGGAMPVISISIRGSDAAHTEYYVEGHEVSSSMDGLPGMTIDPSLFGGLEIARGGGSGFVRGGLAGTLNFLPESRYLPPRVSLTAGDDNSIALSGALSSGINRISLSTRRLSGVSGSTAYDGAVLVNGSADSFGYGCLAAASSGETESPDWTLPADGRRNRYSIDLWGRWTAYGVSFSAGLRTGRHQYSADQPSPVHDTHDEVSTDLSTVFKVNGLPFQLEISAMSSFDAVRSTSIGDRSRLTGETALSVGYSSIISLSTSVSVNAVESENILNGAVISAGAPLLDSLILFHASGSSGFRRPSLNDLYWPEDNFAVGNPDLLPERSLEFETGVSTGILDWLRFSTTSFIAETQELIRWEPGPNGKWTPDNISQALRKGLESEIWLSGDQFEVTASLTLLQVTDNSDQSINYGRILPYTPDYTFAVETTVNYPSWTHWTLSASGMGTRFTNYSETSWMPAYTMYSAGIDLHPDCLGQISLNGSVENLFDTDYQETNGYAGRSRTLHLGIQWNGN